MKYLTINEIKEIFQNLTDNHQQLKSYGYGLIEDMEQTLQLGTGEPGQSTPDKMPFVWQLPVTASVSNNELLYNIEILFGDLVRSGELKQNQVEVESDCLLYAMDFISLAYSYFAQQGEKYYLKELNGITTSPFYDSFDSGYTGQRLIFTLATNFNFDRCEVPYDFN